ncbi:MAG: vanadium-dependent haloperoxidase [Gemmatimonadales bacterium]|nr:vanadium-dependent haloperoxidase [Gemmatimonadales bacterium]
MERRRTEPFSRRLAALLVVAALQAGCREDTSGPGLAPTDQTEENNMAAHSSGATGSSVRWNRKAIEIFRSRLIPGSPPPNAGRIHAYLTLAQYRAVLAASQQQLRPGRRPALEGAAAGASVVILTQFYPLDAAIIDAELTAQRAEYEGRAHKGEAFDLGEAIGREVGAAVLAQAATDNFGLAPLPTQPTGPGYWVSSGAPTVKGGFGARPFFLRSGSEINAPPPPAFGSAEYLAALAEVRALSDSRTPEQVAITQKWVPFSGVLFNGVASDLIEKHDVGELRAARILAYGNLAAFDAIIGCFDTKFVYWFIRPTQADPGITLATGLPNHPSYPSAHSCETGAWQAVLSDQFPSERKFLNGISREANLSRVFGGLHYRFDGDAGLKLGRKAGRLALRRGIGG